MSIRNQSGKERSLPYLVLVDSKGASHNEYSEGPIPGWLGMLRTIAVGETIEGQIVFDTASDSYKLRLTDGGEDEDEATAFVALPARIPSTNPMDIPAEGK